MCTTAGIPSGEACNVLHCIISLCRLLEICFIYRYYVTHCATPEMLTKGRAVTALTREMERAQRVLSLEMHAYRCGDVVSSFRNTCKVIRVRVPTHWEHLLSIGVAPGPAPAGPLFAEETDFMKIKAGQFAHTSRLRGEGVTISQEIAL